MNRNTIAIEKYTKVINENPNSDELPVLYKKRAEYKNNLGDYFGAIDDYTMALKLDPKDFSLYLERGLIKRSLKDYRGTVNDLNEYIATKSDNFYIM